MIILHPCFDREFHKPICQEENGRLRTNIKSSCENNKAFIVGNSFTDPSPTPEKRAHSANGSEVGTIQGFLW